MQTDLPSQDSPSEQQPTSTEPPWALIVDMHAIIALFITLGLAYLFVPEPPWRHLDDPYHLAATMTPVLAVLLLATRAMGSKGPVIERNLFVAMLVVLPLVYLWAAIRTNSGSWVYVELAGLLLFSLFAWAGVKRSSWYLVWGLGLHGVVWDLWHRGQQPHTHSWYSTCCLIIDLGFAIYLALRIAPWRRAGLA